MKKIYLNFFAAVMSTTLWFIIHQHKQTRITRSVPLCFYNVDETCSVKAPETVKIVLSGTRQELMLLDRSNLSAHIDASSLKRGVSYISLSKQHLCLPSTISVHSYAQAPLKVTYALTT